MNRRLRDFVLACALLGFAAIASAAAPLSVGGVPQFPAEDIFRNWTPVLNKLTERTGIQFKLKVYASIPEFEADFLKGGPDIAYMNPYHVVMANKAAGYIPLVRDDKTRLSGILVVRKDSPITAVKELEGATIAFPAPNAFGASLYMRALLEQDVGIRVTATYVKTHSNVYRYVIARSALAGGGVQRTLAAENQGVQDSLRVIFKTPPAYSHPLSAHPRVPDETRAALQKAFIALASDPANQPLLDAILMPLPVAAQYGDYAPLAKLGLERYVVLEKD